MPEPASLPELPSWSVRAWIIAGFAFLMLLVYGQSLQNDFVRLDDGLLIFENPAIQDINPTTLKTIFTTYDPELYIPLTFLSYQIDYQIGQIDAFPYHAQNLFWHTLNALMVAWLGYLLSRRGWVGLLLGLLFALHPLNTEAVAWASGRKDVLSTFFFFASIIGYLYYREDRRRRLYVLSIGLFLLGLLSKVMVITLPVILLLIDYLQRRPWSRAVLVDKIPYVVLSIVFGIVALFGKQEILSDVSLFDVLLLGLRSSVFYIEQLLWPVRFAILYPYEKPLSVTTAGIAVSLLLVPLLIGIAVAIRKRSRILLFGIAWYFVTVAPTFTNLIKDDSFLASDRYAYLPLFGLLFPLLMTVWLWLERQPARMAARLQWGLLAACILLLGTLSYRQSLVWASSEALFGHAAQLYPNSHAARNNLGNAYRRQGRLEDAERELKAAVDLKPAAKTLGNLGALYIKQSRYDEAQAVLDQATAAEPGRPEPYFGLGILRTAQGRDEEALQAYAKAIEVMPSYGLAYLNSGVIWQGRGDLARAEAEFRKAIAAEPALMQAYYNLAVILEKQDKIEEAKAAYEKAVDLHPWDVPTRTNLGILLYESGDTPGAIHQFEEILKWDPDNEEVRQTLEQLR